MRKYAVLAAAAGLALAGVAKADFVVTFTTQDAGNGNQRVDFWGLNNGANGTGTKALASDLTLADTSGHNLVTAFLTASGTAKADLTGTAASDPYNSDRSFINLLGDVNGGSSGTDNDPTGYSIVSTNPTSIHANYANGVSQFEVVGANLGGGVDATSAANGGKGALIAVAVAPTGDTIHLSGNVGGDTGSPVPVNATAGVPEPTSLSLLGLGLGALVARRRRA